MHVSDICSTDGRKIDASFYATKHIYKYRNTYDWSIKHHVNKVDYTTWRNLLKYIFWVENDTLPIPLGSWIQMSSLQWKDNWGYFLTQDRQFLYHKIKDNTW